MSRFWESGAVIFIIFRCLGDLIGLSIWEWRGALYSLVYPLSLCSLEVMG